MIQNFLKNMAILAALSALSFSGHASNEVQTISMCTEHWPPFVVVEKDKPITEGSWVVLLNEIFDDLPGYNLELKPVPWKRCLRQIREGKVDGTFSLFKKPDRQEYMNFSNPLVEDRSMIWYSTLKFDDAFSWNEYKDLTPYKLGMVRGENFNKEIDKLINHQDIKPQFVNSEVQNFKKLALGRIDIIVKNERVGRALVDQLHLNKTVKSASKPAYAKKRYLSFSKKKDHSELINLVNKRISKLKSSGKIRKILGYSKAS